MNVSLWVCLYGWHKCRMDLLLQLRSFTFVLFDKTSRGIYSEKQTLSTKQLSESFDLERNLFVINKQLFSSFVYYLDKVCMASNPMQGEGRWEECKLGDSVLRPIFLKMSLFVIKIMLHVVSEWKFVANADFQELRLILEHH